MVTLTAEQVASYLEQGYLLLRASEHDLVTPGELKEWTDEVANWPRVRGKWMPYEEINVEGQAQLMRTEKLVDYHDGYRKLLLGDRLSTLLQQLSGDVSSAPALSMSARRRDYLQHEIHDPKTLAAAFVLWVD